MTRKVRRLVLVVVVATSIGVGVFGTGVVGGPSLASSSLRTIPAATSHFNQYRYQYRNHGLQMRSSRRSCFLPYQGAWPVCGGWSRWPKTWTATPPFGE